jgi:1,4-alpha-glucan branching enzyme
MKRLIVIITLIIIPQLILTDTLPIEYFHNMRNLKKAYTPRIVNMVMTGNISTGKRLLQRGVLFTCKTRSASKVAIAGNFSQWRPKNMIRSNHGIWYYFYTTQKSGTIKYKFNIDGYWTYDSMNTNTIDDNAGSYLSQTTFTTSENARFVTFKVHRKRIIEFRTFRPNARIISLVGDFNNWNPENDILQRNNRGIWTLRKKLPKGTYRYIYIIDGSWKTDMYNPRTSSHPGGNICSLITVK